MNNENNFDQEPTMQKIEDYNGNESQGKKNTVRAVIIMILIVGGFFSYLYNTAYEESKKEYVGTQNNPGITTNSNK